MRQYINLPLCNYRLYGWLGSVALLAALLVAILAAAQVSGSGYQFAVMLVVGGVGFYGVYRLLKKVTIRLAQLTVDADGLTVRYRSADKSTHIPFAEVASYRDEWLRDGRELRFRLRSGQKVSLATNNFLAPTDGYPELTRAVQQTIVQRNATNSLPITREKSFFEKPFAAVLLVAGGAAVLFAVGAMLVGHKPFQGSILTAASTWVAYFGLWRTARANRQE